MTRRWTAVAAACLVVAACGGGHPKRAAAPATTTSTSGESSASTTAAAPDVTTASTAAAAVPATTTTAARPASTAPLPATTTTAKRVPTPTTRKPVGASTTSTAATSASATGPSIGGCPVFPADNAWNQDVRGLPVDPGSARYIASISARRQFLHADFGSDPTYGIPYVITSNAPPVPITYDAYGDESDPGPFPIPLDAPVEAGSDGHVLTVDTRTCTLFELYHGRRSGNGWIAGSGAEFDLRSNKLRPDTWTSADAAGLPILPGLVRYDEVASGEIRHALRFTVDRTQNGFIHPATHQAGTADPSLPPMGLRLRLKASFDVTTFHGEARVVLDALQRYGMIVADNGSSWFITGATDTRWNDEDLNQLKTVPGSAFEAVQTGPIQHGS